MGPTALFDKSFLQSLSIDESVWFDQFFYSLICPLFYVETLSDLAKNKKDRVPEMEVKKIADKFPQMNSAPNSYHIDLALDNLIYGINIPLSGSIVSMNGRPVEFKNKPAVVYDETPEAKAFMRWTQQEFQILEYEFAHNWRQRLQKKNSTAIQKYLKEKNVDITSCRSEQLTAVKELSEKLVNEIGSPFDRMQLICLLFNIPPELQRDILSRWSLVCYRPFKEYAPYFSHVCTVELFSHIMMITGLSPNEPNSYTDIAYLHYIPFCKVFISSDKLHKKCAHLFMRPNQEFIWGHDLKQDLNDINTYYLSLPESIKNSPIFSFARTPPTNKQFLICKIWDKYFPQWRTKTDQQNDDPALLDRKRKEILELKKSPTMSPEKRTILNLQDPKGMIINRLVRRKKGSWYQVPPN